ncbi:PQ-loop repeat-containing protein [Candidatus Woesearchaeota archaeon]|nr:PQ-loop repeat-containing protein [Candidatus Woesearchaeota archaeon]
MHHHAVDHHKHVRERVHSQPGSIKGVPLEGLHGPAEPYPHPNKWMRLLDDTCLVFSVIMPMTTLPQIIEIYTTHNVEGISLLMWVLYTVCIIPFFIYGIAHKTKPLIVLNSLWFVAQITIIAGILMYG